jgi:hypothetical protein
MKTVKRADLPQITVRLTPEEVEIVKSLGESFGTPTVSGTLRALIARADPVSSASQRAELDELRTQVKTVRKLAARILEDTGQETLL